MPAEDILWRGTAHSGQFRVLAVESTHTVQTARDLHDLSPINTLLLGKMISAAAMLSLDLKAENSEVSLRLEGDGILKGGLVICGQNGAVRGYAFNPRLFLEEARENFYPVRHLGKGTLSVIRSIPGKQPSLGYTALSEGEVAQNLSHYYAQSEQIPTAVNLGVLIDKDASIKAAGGFIIQQLPHAQPLFADQIIARLGQTPNVSDLMDMGLTIREVLARFVFPEGEMELQPVHSVQFRCNCSRSRFERALRLLGRRELEEMREGIEPECHFCTARYNFSTEDIDRIIASLEKD
ncbi:MAG: Hsp33 family molecular chaperone HslO [Candidatus Syntrophosphaera sp.]|nr:Hsp33 family molecular chaperone HslO [Candidatus Syntrophosphaera sp.]